MRRILMEEFIHCSSAPNGCPRKRRVSHPLPPLKRHKLTPAPIFSQQAIVEDDDNDDFTAKDDALEEDVHTVGAAEEFSNVFVESVNCQDIPTAMQEKDQPNSYPSVVYEGNVAIVKLGVGQMVVLDGCAMVQVVEGQASMLGYSFPRGTDVLVCSSSEIAELSTIEAHHVSRDGGVESMDVDMADGREETRSLACQLRIASHTLGQNVSTSSVILEKGLSFKLEFVASPGASHGKKRGRQFVDDENQDQEFRDIKRSGPRG